MNQTIGQGNVRQRNKNYSPDNRSSDVPGSSGCRRRGAHHAMALLHRTPRHSAILNRRQQSKREIQFWEKDRFQKRRNSVVSVSSCWSSDRLTGGSRANGGFCFETKSFS